MTFGNIEENGFNQHMYYIYIDEKFNYCTSLFLFCFIPSVLKSKSRALLFFCIFIYYIYLLLSHQRDESKYDNLKLTIEYIG